MAYDTFCKLLGAKLRTLHNHRGYPVIFSYDDIQAGIFKIKQILNKANVVIHIKSSHMDKLFLLSRFEEVFRNLTENHTEEFVAFCSTLC